MQCRGGFVGLHTSLEILVNPFRTVSLYNRFQNKRLVFSVPDAVHDPPLDPREDIFQQGSGTQTQEAGQHQGVRVLQVDGQRRFVVEPALSPILTASIDHETSRCLAALHDPLPDDAKTAIHKHLESIQPASMRKSIPTGASHSASHEALVCLLAVIPVYGLLAAPGMYVTKDVDLRLHFPDFFEQPRTADAQVEVVFLC